MIIMIVLTCTPLCTLSLSNYTLGDEYYKQPGHPLSKEQGRFDKKKGTEEWVPLGAEIDSQPIIKEFRN
jgi:hypothetical protein